MQLAAARPDGGGWACREGVSESPSAAGAGASRSRARGAHTERGGRVRRFPRRRGGRPRGRPGGRQARRGRRTFTTLNPLRPHGPPPGLVRVVKSRRQGGRVPGPARRARWCVTHSPLGLCRAVWGRRWETRVAGDGAGRIAVKLRSRPVLAPRFRQPPSARRRPGGGGLRGVDKESGPGRRSGGEQLDSAIIPDPLWYLPALHAEQLDSLIMSAPV